MPAAAADTLARAAAGPLADARVVAGNVQDWHDFYLLAGTASVTLVGLLFVALSFHLDTLLRAEKAHLLGTARMAFTSYLYVMLLALAFLAPGLGLRMLSMFMLVFSVVLLGYAIWIMRARKGPVDPSERFLRRRFMVTGFVAGVGIVTALQALAGSRASGLMNFGFIVAIMLVNASSIAWDLLVQVARLRQAQGDRTAA